MAASMGQVRRGERRLDSLYDNTGRLGMVVGGSLARGVEVRLDGDVSVEDLAVGRFVTIQGRRRRFFGVLTDIALASTDESISSTPPDVSDPFIAGVVLGTNAFGTVHVTPYLSLGAEEQVGDGPLPAKTIPPHFSLVRESDASEVQLVFGENDARHIWVGSPLDMGEAPVCLDVTRLVERSTGVFGKTGTGKSFLTRILLAEMVQKSEAVSLVFDMHGEYGWQSRAERGGEVKGLKQLFQSKVAVFTLDPERARQRGVSADFEVRISFDDITAEDIATLAGTLGLSEAMVQAAFRLERRLGRGWVTRFLSVETKEEFGDLAGGLEHEGTLSALHRKLDLLGRFGFLGEGVGGENAVRTMMEYLDRGIHVVLEFGKYTDNLAAYVLVANILSRRVHDRYVEQMERAMGERGREPRPLVIVIEEAHKFLAPDMAGQTTFGTIAREMRKYNVTLLVIDQRPGGIDPEVMSQVGTKITCLLDNDRDIDSVLAGVSGRNELRAVLAKLETRQQALIFGHAVPMPVVVRTRTYDAEFYRSVGFAGEAERGARVERDVEGLFGKRR